jgi:hypothetical protein
MRELRYNEMGKSQLQDLPYIYEIDAETIMRSGNWVFISGVTALVIIVSGCNHRSNMPPVASMEDTAISQLPKYPASCVPKVEMADSVALFVRQPYLVRANNKANSPFKELNYNKVIAYDYDCGEESEIIEDGKFCSVVKQQKYLTQAQVNSVTEFLGAKSTYGSSAYACFHPHLGIVFYKDTTVVLYISICLECNYLLSSIEIPILAPIKKPGEDDEYPPGGFSVLGRQKLSALCQQLKFSYCKDE